MKLYEDLYRAYLSARENKRYDSAVIEYALKLEENLMALEKELLTNSYEISPCNAFVTTVPVKREIIAPAFRDRIVQHFICKSIYPICDRKFIHDAYSCRIGKGTHFGIRRLSKFFQACSDSFTKPAYVLKMDVSGFYISINKRKLRELTFGMLEGEAYPYKEIVDVLLDKIIMHNPIPTVVRANPISAWEGFPRNKSLFYSREGCGLPIGNLTSQLFGNIYLNPLDHFAKRVLGCRYYGRYVDDIVIVHNSKEFLLETKERIGEFLSGLELTLHPRKVYLQPISHGCAYLGSFVLPHRIYAGRRIAGNWKKMMAGGKYSESQLQSYLGILGHWDCHNLVKKYNLFNYII